MIELALVNMALLLALSLLPRRVGIRPREDRRHAMALLRARNRGRPGPAARLAEGARRLGRLLWPVFEPRLFVPPPGMGRATVYPVLAIALLAAGGPVPPGDASPSGPEARACSEAHEHLGGRVTTAPAHERMTTPAGAGYLTET